MIEVGPRTVVTLQWDTELFTSWFCIKRSVSWDQNVTVFFCVQIFLWSSPFQTDPWSHQESIHPLKPMTALLVSISVKAKKALQWVEGLTKHLKFRKFTSTKNNSLPSPSQKNTTKHPSTNEFPKRQIGMGRLSGGGGEKCYFKIEK